MEVELLTTDWGGIDQSEEDGTIVFILIKPYSPALPDAMFYIYILPTQIYPPLIKETTKG